MKSIIRKRRSNEVSNRVILIILGKFLHLPLTQVRRICALDDEFRLISKEAVVMLAKASEMFVKDLSSTAKGVAKKVHRKSMQTSDIKEVANHFDKYHFIANSQLPALNKNV